MRLTVKAHDALRKRILAVTKEGLITLWTERIAQLAKSVDLPIEEIIWQGSPIDVASNVIQCAEKTDKIYKIEAECKKRENA